MNRFVVSAGLMLLSGCADLGSHVSGSFACGAPQGTCAPTMTIDDGALAKIVQGATANTPKGANPAAALVLAASQARPYPARQAHIVFPGYTDAKGQRHDPVGVYVTLNDARFVDTGVSDGSDASRTTAGFVPSRTNLVTAASAPNDAAEGAERLPVAPPTKLREVAPANAQTFPSSTVQN